MEKIDATLKELTIEWDNINDSNYNPLPLAIKLTHKTSNVSAQYKNMYHKIEKSIEVAIDLSFKGFSDSLSSYKRICDLNQSCIRETENINESVCTIKRTTMIDINSLEKKKNEIDVSRMMLTFLCKIKEIFNASMDDLREDTLESALYLCQIYKFYDEMHFLPVLDYFIEIINQKRNNLLVFIAEDIIEYVFHSENKISNIIKAIFVLDSFDDIDNIIHQRFRSRLSFQIERLILETKFNFDKQYKATGNMSKIQVNRLIMCQIATSINGFIKEMIGNHDKMNKKVEMYSVKKPNFFVRDVNKYKFFEKEGFLSSIKTEMFRLLGIFTMQVERKNENMFSLENIKDTIDYEKYFDFYEPTDHKEIDFYDNENSYCDYTLIIEPDPEFAFFLFDSVCPSLKNDLTRNLKKDFLPKIQAKLEKQTKKLTERRVLIKFKNKRLVTLNDIIDLLKTNSMFNNDSRKQIFISCLNIILSMFKNIIPDFYKTTFIAKKGCEIEQKHFNLENIDFDENFKTPSSLLNLVEHSLTSYSLDADEILEYETQYLRIFYFIESFYCLLTEIIEIKVKYEKITIDTELQEITDRIMLFYVKLHLFLNIQIITDILYFLKIYLIGTDFKNTNFSIEKIIKLFEVLKKNKILKIVNLEKIIDIVNLFLISKAKNIHTRNDNDIEHIIENLEVLDEVLINLLNDENKGIEDSIKYIQSHLESKSK